jgi:hypothetical protein
MSNNKRSIDPAIIAALIGVMGTICVTIITLYANRVALPPLQPTLTSLPTWTNTPPATLTNTPVPTDTVPAGEPTSTPEPPTFTPEATFTPAPPAIGADWANGCISMLWRPYPASIQTVEDINHRGCLLEPVHLFFADDGRLSFTISGRFDDPQVYGLFAPLPANGTVNVHAFLKSLNDGEIWMGIFAEPDINSQGTIIVIPPGDVRRRMFVQKTMPGQNELRSTDTFSRNPPLYDVRLALQDGTVIPTLLGDTVLDAVPLASAQPWLFVGYRLQDGEGRVDAEFLNLFVQGQ